MQVRPYGEMGFVFLCGSVVKGLGVRSISWPQTFFATRKREGLDGNSVTETPPLRPQSRYFHLPRTGDHEG
ncbi:MAG: hypothetical protein V3S50_09010, partial [Acidobacteriota bacterium]